MRLLLTGASGFVGGHTLVRLVDAGHEVAVLVRNRERLARNAAALGVPVDRLAVHLGDVTDPEVVRRAVAGAGAVIHAAGLVTATNRAEGREALATNTAGTRAVVTAAREAGAAVVYVSSVAALFTPSAAVLTADLPPAVRARDPYTRSKALAEQWVREQQAAGVPIVTVYPGGVIGPPAGDALGEMAEAFVSMLKAGCIVHNGWIGLIDVRDVALVLQRCLEAPAGSRYLAGGRFIRLDELARIFRALTGRRMPVLPTPGAAFRAMGRALDQVRRVVDFPTVFTGEAMQMLTRGRPTDDARVHDELGVHYRDLTDSVAAQLRGLQAAGLLTARHLGRLGQPSTPASPHPPVSSAT